MILQQVGRYDGKATARVAAAVGRIPLRRTGSLDGARLRRRLWRRYLHRETLIGLGSAFGQASLCLNSARSRLYPVQLRRAGTQANACESQNNNLCGHGAHTLFLYELVYFLHCLEEGVIKRIVQCVFRSRGLKDSNLWAGRRSDVQMNEKVVGRDVVCADSTDSVASIPGRFDGATVNNFTYSIHRDTPASVSVVRTPAPRLCGLTSHDFKTSPPRMKALGGSKTRSGTQGG